MPGPLLDWLRHDQLATQLHPTTQLQPTMQLHPTTHLVLFLLPVVVALGVLRGRGRRAAALGVAATTALETSTEPPAVAAVVARGVPGRAALLGTVIDLAARGHLDIDGERLARGGAGGDPLLGYEALLIEALFEDGPVATRADLAGRLPRRVPAIRAAIEAEAASRGLVAADPRRARRRAAVWFGAFGVLAVLGMAFSVAFAVGAFVAALLVGLGTARARRTAAGEMEAGRLRALALRLATGDRAGRLRPYAVALGVERSGLEWLAPLMEPPGPAREGGDGGGRDGEAGGAYGAEGGASGGGGASRGW